MGFMIKGDFDYNEFIRYKNISRETFLRLQIFAGLLEKWQKAINLIGSSTVSDIWIRHIIDSAQLMDYIAEEDAVLDIGSGAGFPGLVLAILGVKKVTLAESDSRKAAFLREAARATDTDITVLNQRAETISLREFSLLSARGFSSVTALFNLLGGSLKTSHKILLLKGKNFQSEIEEARKHWSFDCKAAPSITHEQSAVLIIENLKQEHVP